jgi:hypothetical protein
LSQRKLFDVPRSLITRCSTLVTRLAAQAHTHFNGWTFSRKPVDHRENADPTTNRYAIGHEIQCPLLAPIYQRRVHPNRALQSFPREAPHGQVRLLTICSSLNFVLFISKAPIPVPGAFQIIPGGDYRGQVMFVVTNDPGIAQI